MMSCETGITSFIDIPSKELSITQYREWICETEKTIIENYEVTDRHTSIASGFKLEHTVTPGIYTRELTMTAGSLVFSKIHMETHPFIITKGKVSVYDGDKIQELEAPYKGVTIAGTKRVLYVHEETVWTTFHPTELTDLEEIDKNGIITCDSFEEFEEKEKAGEQLWLG